MIVMDKVNSYTLGILWATCSKLGDKYLVRNEDSYFADHIRQVQGGTVYKLTHSRKGTILYCIRLKKPLYTAMEALGWSGRADTSRRMPPVDEPDEFCRAYIQCHYSIGLTKEKRPRLRLHGSQAIMEEFSSIINNITGAGIKKAQCHSSGSTYVLYYQSAAEIRSIYNWIRSGDHSPQVSDRFTQILLHGNSAAEKEER